MSFRILNVCRLRACCFLLLYTICYLFTALLLLLLGHPANCRKKSKKVQFRKGFCGLFLCSPQKKNNFDFFLLVHTIFIALFLFHFRLTLQCLKLVCHSVRLGFFFPSYSIILQRLSMVRATLFLNNLVHTYLCRQLNRIVYVFRNIIIA